METIEAALENRIARDGLCVAGVGYLPWSDRDAIPQAADFLLTESNVSTVVVYGIVAGNEGRESIIGSLRASSPTFDVDGFLKRTLGRDRAGKYYGGGRARAGGFEIDLDFLADESIDDTERAAKWGLVEREVRSKLFDAAEVGEGTTGDAPDDCS
jgi:nanoRNase/pAp phosphatase (c-di-AMP/oligoRNAs hydrolase)